MAAYATTLVLIAGQTWVGYVLSQTSLSDWLTPQIVWLFPLVTMALVGASLALYSPWAWNRERNEHRLIRWIAVTLFVLLIAADVASVALLIGDVFRGLKLAPLALLAAGAVMWLVNVCVFALAYWEMDDGGPEVRAEQIPLGDHHERLYPDLVFPQQSQGLQPDGPGERVLVARGWQPSFGDYLYVSLTAATAFSPTDAMPYTLRAKFTMGSESTISLVIIAMLVARAINIAHG